MSALAAAVAEPRQRAAALVLICLILFLPGWFSLPAFDRDEARFAQASRQMLETGQYVDIRFQDEARHKKPVGIYWLQAASVALTGSDPAAAEIWPYRLPSLVAAVVAVLITAWAGNALFGPTAGWLGALMLAGCLVLGVEARMAKTDACLLATVVAAQAALALAYRDRDQEGPAGWGLCCLFWGALGIGVLIKGPVGPMVSAATVLALVVIDRRARWLKRLRPLAGLALVVVIAAPWLIAIAIQTKGAFFAEAVGHDLLGKVASGQESKGLPPGYYLGTFWITFWPFGFLALLAAPWVWRRRREWQVRFCLAWLVPTWIIFELVSTKLLHYTLPVFPALALLTAAAALDHFDRTAERPRRWLFGLAAGLAVLVTVALAAALVVLPQLLDHRLQPSALVLAPLLLGLILFAVVRVWQQREPAAIELALAAAVIAYGIGFPTVLARTDGLWLSRSAGQAVAAVRPCPGTVVAAAGYSEPSLVFELGTRTRLGTGEAAAEHLLADPACGLALVEARQEDGFRQRLGATAVTALTRFGGFNYSNGRRISMTAYRVTP